MQKNPAAFVGVLAHSPEFVAALVHDATLAVQLSAQVNAHRVDGEVEVIDPAEWKRRYAARLMERGAMPERQAIACGEEAYAEARVDYLANLDDRMVDPVGAADEEMSHWENDGDE